MARILLAEDDAYFADICAANLEDLGHTVTRVGDGLAALNQIKRSPFDLVITDFHMPFLNGGSLIDSLRQLDGHSHVPVILMSGALPHGVTADSLPIQGFLAKPFAHDMLAALVSATLEEAAHLPQMSAPAAW